MFLKSPPPLLLASTSVYRRELLTRLKIPFEWRSPDIGETARPGESALALAARLAREKAQAVALRYPDACVIGSDQVAALQSSAPREPEAGGVSAETLLGKPGTVANCIDQLQRCSGRTLSFVTAVAVVRHRDSVLSEFIDTTRVSFRSLDRLTIERYVARESPLDCAGGFKSEGLGITLCESIDGTDPTALIGLPLIRLCEVLRTAGFDLP